MIRAGGDSGNQSGPTSSAPEQLMQTPKHLVIPAACLALAVAAAAQNHQKVPAPQPAPAHDLDGKYLPAQPVVATPPKSDVQGPTRPANLRPEPQKGTDTVALPNGKQLRA